MPANTDPIFILTISNGNIGVITDSGNLTIWTAGANGSRISSVFVTSTGTEINVDVYVTSNAIDYRLGTVIIPANAGINGIAPTANLLDSAYLNGLNADGSLDLASGSDLKVSASGEGVVLTFIPMGGDY